MAAKTLYNVSNRLPVTVNDGEITKSSGGLVAALAGLSQDEYRLEWIGWPGGEIAEGRQEHVRRSLQDEHGCSPIFLTKGQAEGHYEGYSNSSLWPLLHTMPSRFRYEPQWWEHYRHANQMFADHVLQRACDGDMVWVHDYQLMLLPRMLKEARPSLKIGFFLHTPFPTYEVFRYHPQREELASGVLGADLIGFHTFNYLRNFRMAAVRLLGAQSEITSIRHNGRSSTLGVYPIGINARQFEEQLTKPEHTQQVEKFRQTFNQKQIVLSVERLDYTKGLLHRLDAINLLLSRLEKAQRDHIKFIFVSVPSRENVEEYAQLLEEVEARVGKLNGDYSTLNNSPVHFIHGSVTFTELAALYAMADVGLVTPLVDGMNLVAKEYIAAKKDEGGVLVLSEFAGAAEELYNAFIVNPYDTPAVADAIMHALAMPREQAITRMRPMRERVMRVDAQAWAGSFMRDLDQVEAIEPTPDVRLEDVRNRICSAINAGQRIAMFIDYDGTLREIVRDPAAARPTPEIHDLVSCLGRMHNIDLTVISGRAAQDLDRWLGQHSLSLIGEHGAAVRGRGGEVWEQLDRNVNYEWKEPIGKLLALYADSTPGSFVEDKRTSLVWHYRQTDEEFGTWKAQQLVVELEGVVASAPVTVRHGHKIVEVSASHISKGAAITTLVDKANYDLILCAGDDATDETMFRLDLKNLITIKVGPGDTAADYRIDSPVVLRQLLMDACRASSGSTASGG